MPQSLRRQAVRVAMPRIESVTAEPLHDEALVNVIVRVRDSDGLEGVGEAWWGIHDAARPSRTGSPIIAVVNDTLQDALPGGRLVAGVTETPVGEVTVVGVCIPWGGARLEESTVACRGRPVCPRHWSCRFPSRGARASSPAIGLRPRFSARWEDRVPTGRSTRGLGQGCAATNCAKRCSRYSRLGCKGASSGTRSRRDARALRLSSSGPSRPSKTLCAT